MAKIIGNDIIVTYFHVFPGITLPAPTVTIGNVVVKRKDQLSTESPKNRLFLEYVFSLFKDESDCTINTGSYIVDEGVSAVEEVWFLLRYASFLPHMDEEINRPKRRFGIIDWFSFYTPQKETDLEKNFEIFSIDQNGSEIWTLFSTSSKLVSIHRLHLADEGIRIASDELKTAQRISALFSKDGDYDIESIKLAERIRKATYWYNKSYELNLCEKGLPYSSQWDVESELLYMAIAFETLFQPSKADIQKHLETSLKVIFPDNEFVPKWLTQFYAARSAIAHGSSIDQKDIEFKPDKSGHNSLIYWSRRIFRTCIEAIIAQWESATKSGLLSEMTPNRLRLNRVYGKLRNIPEDTLYSAIPEELRVDIRNFHASWLDTPGEEYLAQTYNVGKILASMALKSGDVKFNKLREPFIKILDLPEDWFKEMERREEACEIYAEILAIFGDEANVLSPLAQLDGMSKTETTLYHWARFAYGHIWSIDL